jgi:hypothetical protein
VGVQRSRRTTSYLWPGRRTDDMVDQVTAQRCPAVAGTVVREAFDSGLTLYFSDHSSLRLSKPFVVRHADGDSETLSASPAGLVAHTSTLVSLIGMEVESVDVAEDGATTLSFTSGVALILF